MGIKHYFQQFTSYIVTSVLLMEETRQITDKLLSHKVVLSTPCHGRESTHNLVVQIV